MPTLALSFHLWWGLFCCRAVSRKNTGHLKGLQCVIFILTCVLENICSGVLLAESCGLGKLFRTSFSSLIAHGHRLAVTNYFHLVADHISFVQVRYYRSFIIFVAKSLVQCAFIPINVIFVSHFCMLVASHVF